MSFPATVRSAAGSFRDVVTDVSPSGFFLQADRHRLRPGERVRVSFSLPVEGRLVPLEVEGVVARVVKDAMHRTKGIGIQITRPSPRVVQTIEGYLAQRDHLRGEDEGTMEGDDQG